MENFNINQTNIQPANNDSLAGVIKFSFQQYMKGLNTVMPAKIIAYDRSNNTAQVQVMINTVNTSYEQFPGVQIASVPVLLLGGGGFMLSFPLKEGDLGWLIATDRDMSLFLKNFKANAPGVLLQRNFSSSYFIPDLMTNYTIQSEDADRFVIQKNDGSVKISFSDDSINIKAPTSITLTAPDVIIDGKLHNDYIKPDSGTLYIEGTVEAEGGFIPDIPPP